MSCQESFAAMKAHQKTRIFDTKLYSLYSFYSLCRGLCQQLLVNIPASENLICSHVREDTNSES